MINDYVNKLIENLPDDIKNRTMPEEIDLVLDGGVFNGSYHVGALYFLKEMERRKYIKINRTFLFIFILFIFIYLLYIFYLSFLVFLLYIPKGLSHHDSKCGVVYS